MFGVSKNILFIIFINFITVTVCNEFLTRQTDNKNIRHDLIKQSSTALGIHPTNSYNIDPHQHQHHQQQQLSDVYEFHQNNNYNEHQHRHSRNNRNTHKKIYFKRRGHRLKNSKNGLRYLSGLSKHNNNMRNNNNNNNINIHNNNNNNNNNNNYYYNNVNHNNKDDAGGLWPSVINVALKAIVTTNATCGQHGREEYCKMFDAHPHRKSRAAQCGICDSSSPDLDKRHPIINVLDDTNKWWQSSTLYHGKENEYVTITLDLQQIYEVTYLSIQSGITPRPAAWLIERSINGDDYFVWQYFGVSDKDCRNRYDLPGNNGMYNFKGDSEVICSTQFSKIIPLENGEMHLSLLKNRPGLNSSSTELLNFTIARYVRIRLQGMHSTIDTDMDIKSQVQWLVDNDALAKRSFYSIRSIKILGRLYCSGHSNESVNIISDDSSECHCSHNTCGKNCEKCCPLYNQRPFQIGTNSMANQCEKCECYGHSKECIYDPEIDAKNLSLNGDEEYGNGGGVCLNCTDNTMGINCEKCIENYFRPIGISPHSKHACIPCDCDPMGSYGICNSYGGDCQCKMGFTGMRCALCLPGYKGENCTRCDCDARGTMPGGQCESHCQCKLHVEGRHCNKCLPGYFALRAENSEGCMKCYCSGVGISCKSSQIKTHVYESLEGWKVTDISKSHFAYPSRDNETGNLVFGMYELPDTESVYWLAPRGYTGNLLNSYGSGIAYTLAWVIVRGDTSGKPTTGPSIILLGRNGMKIAFGDRTFLNSNATINIVLSEDGWYHVPRTVKDIVTRLRRTEYRGDPVTRVQFMSVLSDVESILIRGTFHTDQVESVFVRATLYSGENDINEDNLSLVEQCDCPIGYSGSSCESCSFGYVRIYENSTAHERLGKCLPCSCNGHAATCDLDTQQCGDCQHNTFGDRCERCAVGYYGNAMYGTENDCKRCACPLLDNSNNFSPSCQLQELTFDINQLTNELHMGLSSNNNNSKDYICTQCPIGYIGDHCEICDDGFYGTPAIIGSKCLPCPCDGGPCDPYSGRCIQCLGNTEGWRCERCKSGYWGNPYEGCELCNCYENGSITNICDAVSGQCLCKSRFAGRFCDECEIGYGNVSLNCPNCDCNENGSLNTICDKYTGQCFCKSTTEGLKCNECIENYYGLSINGCDDCRCNPYGSINRRCNRNGFCNCRMNITGRTCDKCKDGHWNLESGRGCELCKCDMVGSLNTTCQSGSGQCPCKTGIGGLSCDRCLDNFYGFSKQGCKKCDDCSNTPYVCDPDTGRCICPLLSVGHDCQQCYQNSWGWEYRKGCKHCNCDHLGAIGQSCDLISGQCICREGFFGRRCDECAPGYYGYPNCQRCNCNRHGTQLTRTGLGECDHRGQCPCKHLVTGLKCDQCRQSTFGLSINNVDGCTRCFCFGRSKDCEQSDLTWSQIKTYGSRNLSIDYITKGYADYVVVVQMEGTNTHREDAEIELMNDLQLIPSSTGNVSIGTTTKFSSPLYFQLPPNFSGDRTTSYDGYLKYSLTSDLCNNKFTENIIGNYPLIQIHSHNNFVIDYFGPEIFETSENASYAIRMFELNWRYHFYPLNVTRAILMTALQNIKHIFVRGSSCADFTQVVIGNITLDSGMYLSGATNNRAIGVEQCLCPPKYNGSSCQNPGNGYYRRRNFSSDKDPNLQDLVGHAIPCNCNGRTEMCDSETGHCQKCRENTGGINCEMCAEGYYGEPNDFYGCQPCPCPETNRNFARGCTIHRNKVNCICKSGYTGSLCDKCMMGYYGYPNETNGRCIECDCDPNGIVSDECDEVTGQCNCRIGVTGRRCDKCEESRSVLYNNQCESCDNCTQTLLDRCDDLRFILDIGSSHINPNGIPAPWPKLKQFDNLTMELELYLKDFLHARNNIENFNEDIIEKLELKVSNGNKRIKKIAEQSKKENIDSNVVKQKAFDILEDLKNTENKMDETLNILDDYGTHDHHVSIPMAVNEAESLLHNIKQHELSNNNHSIATAKNLECAKKQLFEWIGMNDQLMNQIEDINDVKKQLLEFDRKLDDTIDNAYKSEQYLNEAELILNRNRNDYDKLHSKYTDVLGLQNDLLNLYNTSIIPKTDVSFNELNDNHDVIEHDIETIDELCEIVDQLLMEHEKGFNETKNNHLLEAKDHANDLTERAKEYANMFKSTKDGAEAALLASTAHKNIIEAIEVAKAAADHTRNAVVKTQNELYPKNKESVIDKGLDSLEKSHAIQSAALEVNENLKDLDDSLNGHKKSVNSIENKIWQSGLENNEITSTLNGLSNDDTMNIIKHSIDISGKVSDQMREVRREAVDINNDVYKLKIKLTNLEPNWETKLGLAEENVSTSLSNVRTANSTLSNIESIAMKNRNRFEQWNDTVSSRLQEIRDKIAQARHATEGIRVSLQSKPNSEINCIRSFIPQTVGLTTSTTIKMSIALNSDKIDSPLLFVQGEDHKFLAIELVQRRVRFLWNLGGDTGSITHPMELNTRDPKYDDAWYHIEANRIMNLGTLNVRQMSHNGLLIDSSIISGVSGSQHTRFMITQNDRIWVGGVPNDIKPIELQNDTIGLGVVLHQIYIDDKQLGLWHFVHSQGECIGGMLGAHETSPNTNARQFNGIGYAIVSKAKPKPVKRNVFSFQMTFKTFDENALLFLAVDEINNRSVSLTLHEGKILFRIDYGDETKLEINTTNKYNTGTWISVTAARQFKPKGNTEGGNLLVNNEEKSGSPTVPITANSLPDLSKAIYYLGGVQPGFKSGITKAPGADHAYLGCMKDIQINGETYDPLESVSYYGVEPSCKDAITKAGFYGNGYVELPGHSLLKNANFGFVFRTLQSKSLLMLAAYPPTVEDDYDELDVKGNYSVAVIDGKIMLWLNTGYDRIELQSNVTVNDGEFHVLNINKSGRKIELRIDDQLQGNTKFPTQPSSINMPKDAGGFYIGGTPLHDGYDLIAPTLDSFEGAIKDIVFNNRTVYFNDVLNFTNVHMGRNGPNMGFQNINNMFMKTEPIGKSFTAVPEGCHRVGVYSYEPNAFKFGDGPQSHAIINIQTRHLWKKNFSIQFDFRTFYPDGVLFVAPGTKEKQKHFIGLFLRDGKIHLIVRGRKKQEITLSKKLNDGQWHNVLLNNVNRKLYIGVNGTPSSLAAAAAATMTKKPRPLSTTTNNNIINNNQNNNQNNNNNNNNSNNSHSNNSSNAIIRLPKKISAANMMYIGGILDNGSPKLPPELLSKLEEFKGCIRRFRVNNITQDLAKPGRHKNVGQCFPRVEKGSYFPGDAYAIYKRNFHVGKYLELEFEFRTSELNGILLSVSEPVGFPALSIEMNNGKIVMSCDLGDGNPFFVETINLPSKYALCDNRWHNVSAMYDSEQILLRIDRQSSLIQFAQNRMSGKVHTKSPLYIGGIPDTAPSGTLLSRDNFKGCIRNVAIRNEFKDWTDMDDLHNVLLSECLAIH